MLIRVLRQTSLTDPTKWNRDCRWKRLDFFAVFSPQGSKVAFVAERQNKLDLLTFDIAKNAMTSAPYPKWDARIGQFELVA